MPVYKKQLRLPHSDYIGRRAYFVTVCTENRATFFSDSATGRWLLEKLFATAAQSNFTLHAYCVMPDHLHFVSEALADACDLVKFVEGFKQRSAYEFSKTQRHRLWQTRYYDHILPAMPSKTSPATSGGIPSANTYVRILMSIRCPAHKPSTGWSTANLPHNGNRHGSCRGRASESV